MRIERVVPTRSPTRSKVGEEAVWDICDQRLWWADIPAGLIYRYDLATDKNDSFNVGEAVGCMCRRDAGGLIIATCSGFHLFDPETEAKTALVDLEADLSSNRFND